MAVDFSPPFSDEVPMIWPFFTEVTLASEGLTMTSHCPR
jgi:hypothetical protein